MSKIKAKNTLYNDPRYDVVVDSRMLEQHLKGKDQQIAELKQQLHDLPKKIVGDISEQLFNYFKVKNIEEYEKLPLIDSLFTADTMVEILETILKKFGGGKRKNDRI